MAMPSYVASGAIANLTAAGTVGLPAGIAADDILLLEIETANQAVAISNQAGGTWVEVTNSPQGTGTAAGLTSTRLTVFWSRYNGTQTAPTISDSGDHQLGRIHAFRDCKTTGDPWNITSGNIEAASDTSLSATGATTTATDCLVCIMASLMDDAQNFGATWTNASLANITMRQNTSGTGGNDGRHILVTGEKATAGAYNASTNTLTANSVKAMMTIALEGAALTFSGSGAASVTKPIVAASGLLAFVGAAALAVAQPSISATGSLIEARTSTAALTVTKPAVASTGQLVFTGSGALLVTPPAIAGSGTQFFNVTSTAALTVTQPVVAGTGTITQASVTGTGALSVTPPSIAASGLEAFEGSGALGVTNPAIAGSGLERFDGAAALSTSVTISAIGELQFLGAAALAVRQPVIQGGESVATGPAIARSVGTVRIQPTHTGSVRISARQGTSVMDTYTTSNATFTTSGTMPHTSKGPMGQ